MPVTAAIIGGIGTIYSASEMSDANDLNEAAMNKQAEIEDRKLAMAEEDRRRYNETFRPIEDELIARSNPTTADYEQATGESAADVVDAFKSAREQTNRQMMRYGVNPGDGNFASTNRVMDMNEGLAKVGAKNTARNSVKSNAQNLKLNLLNLGKGYKADAGAGYNSASGGYRSIAGNYADQAAGWGGAAGGFLRLGMNAYNQPTQPTQPMSSTTGGTAGVNVGWNPDLSHNGYADGGEVVEGEYMPAEHGQVMGPGTGTSDSVPAMVDGQHRVNLSNGEYVIPNDVVRKLGTNHFDKLIEQHHEPVRRSLTPMAGGMA